MQPDKKQLEVLLIQYFRDCYPDFPKGKIVPSESPDFIITLKSRNSLGIELTRLNPLNAKAPDADEILKNLIREEIIRLTKSLFEGTSSLQLFVKFLFTENMPVKPENKVAVAVQLANTIRYTLTGKNSASFFCESLSAEKLPHGVESLLIVHHPGLKTSIWERSNNLGVSENVVADIRESIHKKDEKLKHYQKQRLNYYWLLITTDRLRGIKSYNLPEKIMNHAFHSRFQHVFLLDLIKSSVFQLV